MLCPELLYFKFVFSMVGCVGIINLKICKGSQKKTGCENIVRMIYSCYRNVGFRKEGDLNA